MGEEEKITSRSDHEDCGTNRRSEQDCAWPEGQGTGRMTVERERRGDCRSEAGGSVAEDIPIVVNTPPTTPPMPALSSTGTATTAKTRNQPENIMGVTAPNDQ